MGDNFEVVKFRAEWSRTIGILFSTPFCGIIFNLLVNDFDATKDPDFGLKLFVSACLLSIGCIFLAQANERVDDYVREFERTDEE